MGTFLLITAIFLNAGGNVLLKLGADRGVPNWYLVAGITLFAVNVLCYVAALRALPLSIAYPVMVGSTFLIVGSAAAFFLHETVTVWHITGYVLILAGVATVSILGR